MNMKIVCTFFLSIVCALPGLRAREDETTSEIRTELVTLALHDPVSDLFIHNGETVVPFRSMPGGIGIPIPYEGPARLVFHRTEDAFLPDAPEQRPAATVTLPRNADRILLLVSQPANGPVRIKALPVDSSSLLGGDYRILNFSHKPIVLKMGAETLQLKPGRLGTLSAPAWRERSMDMPVHMGYPADTGIKTYSSVWGHRPTRRTFLLVFDGDRSNTLNLRRVHDRPPRIE